MSPEAQQRAKEQTAALASPRSREEVIAECERLLKDITPGEWAVSLEGSAFHDGKPNVRASDDGGVSSLYVAVAGTGPHGAADAEFIAAAPRLVRDLIAIAGVGNKALEWLRDDMRVVIGTHEEGDLAVNVIRLRAWLAVAEAYLPICSRWCSHRRSHNEVGC